MQIPLHINESTLLYRSGEIDSLNIIFTHIIFEAVSNSGCGWHYVAILVFSQDYELANENKLCH